MRVLVSSGTADSINTNQRLRQRIAHGFQQLGLSCQPCAVEAVPALLQRQAVDLLLITGSIADPSVDLQWLVRRARQQGSQVAFWLHDDPYEFDLHWRLAELGCPVFSNEPNCLPYYPPGCQARALALAASPLDDLPDGALSTGLPAAEPEVDLAFCGVAFPQRIAMVRQLAAAGFRLACWGEGWPEDLAGAMNQRLGPLGLRQLYRRCRFVLNLGREIAIANRRHQIAASMPGPRTFEAALVGAVQVYLGQSPRISALYGPGEGVIPAGSVEEVAALVERAIEQPQWLQHLGQAAARHTRRHHLYRHRCHDLLAGLAAWGTQP
ncbi:MAG: glycosyltransferase [Cyanobacteriota bacterium]